MKNLNKVVVLLFLIGTSILLSVTPIRFFSIANSLPTTTTPKVAAFYYGWWGNTTDYTQTGAINVTDDAQWRHWDGPNMNPPETFSSPFTPTMGLYDSADPELIEYHLREAERVGIDAFVVSYWGHGGFEWDNFVTMLQVADYINSNVSLSLYFEIFMQGLSEKSDEDASAIIHEQFNFLYDFITESPHQDVLWYEDGKPVLFVYVTQAVSPNVWENVTSELGDKQFFLVADRPGNQDIYREAFHAIHQYDVYAPTYRGTYFNDFLGHKIRSRDFDQLFIAGVSPGYDDHLVRDGNPPLDRRDGLTYAESWEAALSLNPDWITITSWNEWHEATEIEPSVENGDLALNQTQDYIEIFKSGNYSYQTIIYRETWQLASWSVFTLAGLWIGFILLARKYSTSKESSPVLKGFSLLAGNGALGYIMIAEYILNRPFGVSGTPYALIAIPILVLLLVAFPWRVDS